MTVKRITFDDTRWWVMTLTIGLYRFDVIWNHPVWALSYGRWVYSPDEDSRAWFMRSRIGPFKVQVTKERDV